MLTKCVLTLTALAFLLAPAPTLAGTVPVEGEGDPALYVVKVHADWCGSCTALVPILEEVHAGVADQPVLFVQLDVTDSTLTSQARLLAAALGRRRPLQGQQPNRPRPAHQRPRPHPAGNGDQAKLRR